MKNASLTANLTKAEKLALYDKFYAQGYSVKQALKMAGL